MAGSSILGPAFEALGYHAIFFGDTDFVEIAKAVKESKEHDRPKNLVAIWLTDNYQDSVDVEGCIVLRTSLDGVMRLPHEYPMPYLYPLPNVQPPPPPSTAIRIGFCGNLRRCCTRGSRLKAVELLSAHDAFECDFILRDSYWGGKADDPGLQKDFDDNLARNDFCLALNGLGNFSMRLYQALSVGRIPIVVVDKHMVLPLQSVVPWSKIAVIADCDENLPAAILSFVSSNDINAAQALAAETYRTCLTMSTFPALFVRHELHVDDGKDADVAVEAAT